MTHTLCPAVATALRGLPPEAGPAAAWAGEAAHRIPAGLAYHFRFGWPLHGDQNASFVLKVAPAARSALASHAPGGWAAAADFCAAWTDPASPLSSGVAGLWLRLGRDARPRHAFYSFAAAQGGGGIGGWTVADALPRLAGAPLAPSPARAFAGVMDAVAPHAELLQAGVRADGTLTLGIYPADPTLLPCLRAAGWPGDEGGVARLAGAMEGLGGQLCATLHVRDGVRPELGLDHHLNGVPEPDRSFAWAELLGRLQDAGVCTPERRRALSGFGATEREGGRIVSRGLGHLELSLRPDAPVQARVFLACTLHPARVEAA